jgi:hypothetical protein
MSITIFPTNNLKFCEENNLIKIHVEDCLCKDAGCAIPHCHYCNGTGEWTEQIYPFELNLANGNFSTLWRTLGLEYDYCGEIDADTLSIAVQRFETELLYNNVFSFDQSRRYIKKLYEICLEALKRGESVTWG